LFPFESDGQLNKYVNVNQIEKSDKMIGFKSEGMFVCITTVDSDNWRDTIYDIMFSKSSSDEKGLFCLTSGIINSFQELKYKYMLLKKNLNYLTKIPTIKKKMVYYYDVIHYMLIKEVIDNEENVDLIKKALKPILNLEEEERAIMVDTLYSYVNSGGNKTKAAKEIYVHRNTFIIEWIN
jgi:Regulator of polyketide synthase expression